MPNHITNKLRIVSEDKELIKRIREEIKGDNECIDFNVIVPEPQGDDHDWYSWRCIHWGTKWNAYYEEDIADDFIEFCTAWGSPIPIFIALSKKHKNVTFEVAFADEDVSFNTGKGFFLGGEEFMDYPEGGSDESMDIYLEVMEEDKEDFVKNEEGYWQYKWD